MKTHDAKICGCQMFATNLTLVHYRRGRLYDIYDMGSGLTAGFGFRISSLNVDYAFVPYGDLGNAHRFSLSYNFNVNAPQQPRVVEVRVKQAVKADMEPIKPPAPQAVKAGVKPTRTGAGNNRK